MQYFAPRLLVSGTAFSGDMAAKLRDSTVQTWKDTDGGTLICCEQTGSHYSIFWLDLAEYRFEPMKQTVTAYPNKGIDRLQVEDVYQRYITPIVQHLAGYEAIHASAVLSPKGVTGFCGYTNSGKSTIAFALGRRGFQPWSDDILVTAFSDQNVTAVPSHYKPRLRPSSVRYFDSESSGKHFRDTHPNDRVTDPHPIRALFILNQLREKNLSDACFISRLQPQAALIDLLPHAHCFSLKNNSLKERMIRNYMTLVHCTPVYSVRYRSGLERLPDMVDEMAHLIEHAVSD